ncbi:MAG: hypothetical protein FWG90_14085, partial [Oscillospiraceae bacterium]|nr:hypothetical protein [Oscillospiraceae bacterium]
AACGRHLPQRGRQKEKPPSQRGAVSEADGGELGRTGRSPLQIAFGTGKPVPYDPIAQVEILLCFFEKKY